MLPNWACIARFVRRFLTKHGEGADRNVDARITDKDRRSAAGALDREMQRGWIGLAHRQRIAADDAARRMHQHVVADRITLGVQALQDAQRALVEMTRHGARRSGGVVECELRVPGHDPSVEGAGCETGREPAWIARATIGTGFIGG